MSYKIPSDEEVSELVLKVMRIKRVVESQAQLLSEVLVHLQMRNPEYKLTGQRLRKLAMRIPEIHVEIKCKDTDTLVDNMETCPVCGSKMERVENMTLEGKKIVIGFKCTFCSYWTGRKLRVPIRYIFRLY